MLRQVTVETGILEGLPAADPRITSFKGIPFAAPPVGKNRWRAPQPAEKWEGVRKAYKFAPISMQNPPAANPEDIYSREWNVDPDIAMSEDCLYLNVWTPAKSVDEKLPVFVWYFGGGLVAGNTQEMEFDGERLARRGIIVVTVNYRLNVFGFLCHPEITAESPDAPANFGYLDQRYGTMWVKRNIAAFGGDPNNITIGGQSSGGGSVMAQVASPMNKGLFQKAIVDSGCEIHAYGSPFFTSGRGLTLADAENLGMKFFESLGVKTLEEARALDALVLRDKFMEDRSIILAFRPVEDHLFLVGATNHMFMENTANMMPMLFGHTSTEYPSAPPVKTLEAFEAFARERYGEDADEFLEICNVKSGSLTEALYRAKMQHIEFSIRLFGQAKKNTGDKHPMYYWVFDPEMPGWDNPGTFHSSDLWFFWETLAKCWRPFEGKHYDLARQMCNYWANFIKNGDPNGKDANGKKMPEWKPYTVDEPARMIFGDTAYLSDEEPSALAKFLVKHYFKTNK